MNGGIFYKITKNLLENASYLWGKCFDFNSIRRDIVTETTVIIAGIRGFPQKICNGKNRYCNGLIKSLLKTDSAQIDPRLMKILQRVILAVQRWKNAWQSHCTNYKVIVGLQITVVKLTFPKLLVCSHILSAITVRKSITSNVVLS